MRKFFIVSGILVLFLFQTQPTPSQTAPKSPEPKRVAKDQPDTEVRYEALIDKYIQNTTVQQPSSNFNISGNGTAAGTLAGAIVNAEKQYDFLGQRLLSIDIGGQSLFLGIGAGTNNSTGTGGVFVGANAGTANTTGYNGVFVGTHAGTANTTGSHNTFVGAWTGSSNTTGQHNTYVGQGAGNSATTGENNVIVGSAAGFYLTTGHSNSMFGITAGGNTQNGSENAFFGGAAGFSNTTGSNNTFVGEQAGDSNLNGNNNTTIGSRADVGSGNLSFATAIGAGSVAPTSNSITLGRPNGQDTVFIKGGLVLNTLSVGGITTLCRNAFLIVATCSSSARYKSNIVPFGSGLDLIRRLHPVSFNWKEGGMLDLGLVAEDVFKVEPLLTTLNQKGEVEGVKYDRVAVVAVNAINEQQKQIEELKKQVEELTSLLCSRKSKAQVCKQNARR